MATPKWVAEANKILDSALGMQFTVDKEAVIKAAYAAAAKAEIAVIEAKAEAQKAVDDNRDKHQEDKGTHWFVDCSDATVHHSSSGCNLDNDTWHVGQ